MKCTVPFVALLSVASAATCVNRVKEVEANFNDLKSPNNGKQIPNGYRGLNWSGGEVEMAPFASRGGITGGHSHPFNNTSGNVYRGSQHIQLSTSGKGTLDPFSLKSFNLACFTFISDVYLKPTKCSLLVTVNDVFGSSHQQIHSYLLDYEEDDFNNPTFTTFTVPQVKGADISIELVGPPVGNFPLPPTMGFYLDNVITEQRCK